MKKSKNVVYLIEDDDDLAKALETLLTEENYTCYRYSTAETFLEEATRLEASFNFQINSDTPNCCLIDVRLPNMSGINLFYRLIKQNGKKLSPVIFLTGHGDLQMAVDSLKKGAFDFLTKPYKTEDLLNTIQNGIQESRLRIEQHQFVSMFETKLNLLTSREKELIEPIISGLSNKEIAAKFQNSVRTIELHRARFFEKLDLQSAVELAKFIERFNAFNADLNN